MSLYEIITAVNGESDGISGYGEYSNLKLTQTAGYIMPAKVYSIVHILHITVYYIYNSILHL